MLIPSPDFGTVGFALSATLYALLGVYLVRSVHLRPEDASVARRALLVATAVTVAWSIASALDRGVRWAWPAYLASLLDILRYGCWFAFVALLLQPALGSGASRTRLIGIGVIAAALVVALAAWAVRLATGAWQPDARPWFVMATFPLPVLGLVAVEQLFRNVAEDFRWNAKPACLALAVSFGFDLYLHAQALLFGAFDADVLSVRGAVQAVAVPLLYAAARRRLDVAGKLQLSRQAAFHSATLVLVGSYLLLMSAVGYYVRFSGGAWGPALQVALLVVALAFIALVTVSGAFRARMRVFVGKHFFSYRYDYREEWLRFTSLLSVQSAPGEVANSIIRGLGDMVESTAGALWARDDGGAGFRQIARWNQPERLELEPGDSGFSAFLATKGWVIDLHEYRSSPRLYEQVPLPNWLLADAGAWLVVPLRVGDELLGFVTLAQPRARIELNWEVRDLLKTAGQQAAGFLAQLRAAEALIEARKFDAFNRMSAFVVHDLKNIVSQLSLMLRNAERHHDNPEFQKDMLLTVESSLDKMRRLMLQLREGASPPGVTHGVEIAPILRRLARGAESRGRRVEIDVADGLATRGSDERLERVFGHLIDNALDATNQDGRVAVRVQRVSGQIRIDVEDDGTGMSEDFVRSRLFRPFNSTKSSGMGIGSYESFQYVRELGGSVDVDSRLGEGTRIRLTLPVFDPHAQSVAV